MDDPEILVAINAHFSDEAGVNIDQVVNDLISLPDWTTGWYEEN